MRWLSFVLLGIAAVLPAWAGGVHVFLSEPDGLYRAAAEAFQDALGKTVPVSVQDLAAVAPDELRALSRGDNLLVPIGMKALRRVADDHAGQAAVLGVMVPGSGASGLDLRLGPGRLSYVYVGQSPVRLVELARVLLPGRTRLGVLASRENADLLDELAGAARRHDLHLTPRRVEKPGEVGPALRLLLADQDVLLLIPDAVVLAEGHLRHILMGGYRMQVPILGYSSAVVKAGALAAVFSTPAQIGVQAGGMARRWAATGRLPPAQYATDFSVEVNRYLGRSMGLPLPPEHEVNQRMGARSP